jgi:hypothetical protein
MEVNGNHTRNCLLLNIPDMLILRVWAVGNNCSVVSTFAEKSFREIPLDNSINY